MKVKVLAASLISLISLPLLVAAMPKNATTTRYYEDQAMRKVVGTLYLPCTGGIKFRGRETEFEKTFEGLSCSSRQIPKPKPPCEFTPKGCGNLPE